MQDGRTIQDLLELGLPEAVLDILRQDGIEELYPPQAEAMPIALRGDNLLMAVPTASGKSLVAYLSVVKAALSGGKALYIVPLRALASEKYDDLKRFEDLGIKVGISIGDFDSPDMGLKRYDILISTSEKADSLLRHRTDWLNILKVIVADEIHLMDSSNRGPTLEVILSRFRQLNPSAQIIGLSATVSNAKEIAEWLDAELVSSDWRPVKLRPGVYHDEMIHFSDGKKVVSARSVEDLIAQSIREGGQCLVFVSTRKNTESLAGNLCGLIRKELSPEDREVLGTEAKRFVKGTSEPTSFGRRLASFVASGVAYHHAGLRHDQRKLVEELYKQRRIKVITATPTLAAGINLPARKVIIRDTKRWNGAVMRNEYIPVMEIKQMLGRAGRPRYDTEGEGIIVARYKNEVDRFMDNYIHGPSEDVVSKLGSETALRSHILSTIATGYAGSMEDIMEFIGSTFFAHQQETWRIKEMVENVVDLLLEKDFLTPGEEGGLRATFFGKRVSDLYIDPMSAVVLREALDLAVKRKEGPRGPTSFSYLTAVCSTVDMSRVSGYLRKSERHWIEDTLEANRRDLLISEDGVEEEKEFDDESLLGVVKTASLLLDWIGERTEDQMTDFYGIGPGDIRARVETAEWMLYSMAELARIFKTGLDGAIMDITRRMKYGIKKELLDLCSLRGIGRVRARVLFNTGFKGKQQLKDHGSVADLSKIPGIAEGVAKSIMEQVKGKGDDRAKGVSKLEDYMS